MDSTFTFSFIASTWKGNSERQLKEEKKTNGSLTERAEQTHGSSLKENTNNATFYTNADVRSFWYWEFHLVDYNSVENKIQGVQFKHLRDVLHNVHCIMQRHKNIIYCDFAKDSLF